ncbi:hypothetical protein BHE74_00029785 [Ensete ventricosum]|nr:hypothetical protein BHE74_00029785 [Ensete ventricosum]
MLSLTSVVTSGIAESYSGTVGVVVWGEDMVRHAALMASGGRVRWCSVRTRPPRMLTISIDALEAGLRFPLHPVIGECLGWWRISPAASSIPDSAPPAPRTESGSTSEVQEIPIEEARGAPEVSCKRRGEDPISQRKKDWRKSPHKADRVVVKGKGPTDVSEEPMAPRQKLMLVREL